MSTVATETDRLMQLKEVAETLGMSKRTLERRIDEGILPDPEFNGQRRVYRASMMPDLINRVTKPRGKR